MRLSEGGSDPGQDIHQFFRSVESVVFVDSVIAILQYRYLRFCRGV